MNTSCVLATTLDLSVVGGPTDHFTGIAGRLAARGHQVVVLSPKPRNKITQSFPKSLKLVHYSNVRTMGLPGAAGAILALPKLWRLRHLRSLYIRSSPGTLPITWLGRLAGFRSIIVEHNGWLGDEVAAFGRWRGWARFVAWCQVREAKFATMNRVVTVQLGDLVVGRGVVRSKVVVIGNGIDACVFHPLDRDDCRRRLGIAESSKPILAFVGNLWPGAGVEVVFMAMKQLKSSGRDVQLMIAGDGISRRGLELSAKWILCSDGSVRFLGYLPSAEANVVIGAADVGLAPYLGERNTRVGISPLKLFAYAAAGRTVVASSLPGMEKFSSQPWIFLAEAGSPASLAGAIERALASNRAEFSASARAFAERNDWSVVADRIGELLFADAPSVDATAPQTATPTPVGRVR